MSHQTSPVLRNVRHFKHQDPTITHFGTESIRTADNLLTLIIRTDAQFATRDLQHAFRAIRHEISVPRGADISPEHFSNLLENAYQAWGKEIIKALADALNYSQMYGLPPTSANDTHVHFHSADSLAQSVIRKACLLLKTAHSEKSNALFISLDDMIHEDVFREFSAHGAFKEIGFSRLFSHQGEEQGFVGRPGRDSIERQIEDVCITLQEMRKNSKHRIPIILLEDNVRRAKTLQWIFNEMDKGNVFKDGKLVGIATCFSVATPEERAKICHEGREIPLIIGMDYTQSKVDVVTPRDHFFDGLVVRGKDGSLGRLPSFMLPNEQISKNFKIHPDNVESFMIRIIDANTAFCDAVSETVGIEPRLNWFTPGPAIAEALDLAPSIPMTQALFLVKRRGLQNHLRLVK
jgi:hypothetical protein